MTEPTIIKFDLYNQTGVGGLYYSESLTDISGEYVTKHDLDNANYALAELRDGSDLARVAAALKIENERLREALEKILAIDPNGYLKTTAIARDALQKTEQTKEIK